MASVLMQSTRDFIETPLTAGLDVEIKDSIRAAICMGRAGQPEDISALAVWLCSNQAAYLTGQSIVVDGGYTA
jgi:3-oxoacyl-[acyl-carrier protein] reductase